jgi:hypothetical protein
MHRSTAVEPQTARSKRVDEALRLYSEQQLQRDAEKSSLKVLARDASPACIKRSDDCLAFNKLTPNLAQATRDQCSAYCTNLRVENCNPTSPHLREAKQLCIDGKTRDSKAADMQARSRDAPPIASDRLESRPMPSCYDLWRGRDQRTWDDPNDPFRKGNCRAVRSDYKGELANCTCD